MKICKVEAHGFRGLPDGSYSLAAGLNVAKGYNGSGKTSLLNAIGWALSGVGVSGLDPRSSLRWGADSATVKITLESKTTLKRETTAQRGEDGRLEGTSESGEIDSVAYAIKEYAKGCREALGCPSEAFGLDPVKLMTDPHYFIELCFSNDWKKARDFVLALVDTESAEAVALELPEKMQDILKGIDLSAGVDGPIDELSKNIKETKATVTFLTSALKRGEGGCPICGCNGEWREHAATALSNAKRELAALQQKALALDSLRIEILKRASLKAEKEIGLRFDLYKENMNGTTEQCIVPYLKSGKPLKLGSKSEIVGAGVAIIKRASKRLGLPKLPILIDEGGEITPSTLESWGLGDWQVLIARAEDCALHIDTSNKTI